MRWALGGRTFINFELDQVAKDVASHRNLFHVHSLGSIWSGPGVGVAARRSVPPSYSTMTPTLIAMSMAGERLMPHLDPCRNIKK